MIVFSRSKSENSLNRSSAACGRPKNLRIGLNCLYASYLQILKVSCYLDNVNFYGEIPNYVSVLRNCFSKTEMRQFGASRTDGLKESKKRILKPTTGYNNLLTQVRAQNDGNLRKTERSTKVGEHAGRSSKRSI